MDLEIWTKMLQLRLGFRHSIFRGVLDGTTFFPFICFLLGQSCIGSPLI
jgi:hypothetical protein